MKKKSSFSIRGFVSLLLVLSFSGLALSGIILYFAPPTSFANSTQWTLTGLSKVQWSSVHMVSALTMLFLAIIHLFIYNWKSLMCYIRQRRSDPKRTPYELIVAVIVALIIYVGAILLIPPFSWLEQGNELIKDHYRELVHPGRGMGMGR